MCQALQIKKSSHQRILHRLVPLELKQPLHGHQPHALPKASKATADLLQKALSVVRLARQAEKKAS